MRHIDLPAMALLATLWIYWIIVGAMIVRRRRRTRKMSGFVPEQGIEKAMGLMWIPLVAAWLVLPWLALRHTTGPWALPPYASSDAGLLLRGLAALLAVAALGGSIRAWRQMGRNWTIAVTQDEKGTLLTGGMFSRVRHPIYALSILLMLASLVVLPTWPMLAVAAIHLTLMTLKARNEERFMLGVHGDAYARYCRATGRFVPRRAPR